MNANPKADTEQALDAAIADLGLTYTAEFVPWSKSRSAKPNPKLTDYRLEWRITLQKNGAKLTAEYGQGIGHIPGYRHLGSSADGAADIQRICNSGQVITPSGFYGPKLQAPPLRDVLYALVQDAEAIEYPDFESWAEYNDCDTDSRSAEKTYRACLKLGLELRLLIGDEAIRELRQAFLDANY